MSRFKTAILTTKPLKSGSVIITNSRRLTRTAMKARRLRRKLLLQTTPETVLSKIRWLISRVTIMYRSADKNVPLDQWERRNKEPIPTTEFKDEGVESGEIYFYYVRAVD